MKAYLVWIDGADVEDGIDIVQAETPVQAKYNSVFCSECDWTELRCKRASMLDGIDHPTDADYYEAGIWVVCSVCSNYVVSDWDNIIFNIKTQQAYHPACVADIWHTARWAGDTIWVEDL